jgi:gluconokinase
MTKAGWRDDRSARLQHLVVEYGFAERPIETIFDLFDYDEGRDPITERPWLRV